MPWWRRPWSAASIGGSRGSIGLQRCCSFALAAAARSTTRCPTGRRYAPGAAMAAAAGALDVFGAGAATRKTPRTWGWGEHFYRNSVLPALATRTFGMPCRSTSHRPALQCHKPTHAHECILALRCRDDSLLLGDVVLLANNAISLDLWVIARKATRGNANPLASFDYFLAHLPAEVNHASMLVLAWLLAGTHRLRHTPQAPPPPPSRHSQWQPATPVLLVQVRFRRRRRHHHPATTAHHHA